MRLSDIGPLQGLTTLELLSLNGTDVADLGQLRGLGRLHTLTIDRTKVRDLSPLADLPALEELSMFDVQATDLAPLMGLQKLRCLSMMSARPADLRPLLAIASLWQEDGPDSVTEQMADRTDQRDLRYGLNFMYSAATEADRKLYQLSMQRDEAKRTRMTRAYLRKLPPWPEPMS